MRGLCGDYMGSLLKGYRTRLYRRSFDQNTQPERCPLQANVLLKGSFAGSRCKDASNIPDQIQEINREKLCIMWEGSNLLTRSVLHELYAAPFSGMSIAALPAASVL